MAAAISLATERDHWGTVSDAPGADAPDGLKVDQKGNVYSTGPGGLWILSPEGQKVVLDLGYVPAKLHE